MRIVHLRAHHRVVIPADLVRKLNLAVGDEIVLEEHEGVLYLIPRRTITRRLREGFSGVPHSLADRLIANRQVQR